MAFSTGSRTMLWPSWRPLVLDLLASALTSAFSHGNKAGKPALRLTPVDFSDCSFWPAESFNWTVEFLQALRELGGT